MPRKTFVLPKDYDKAVTDQIVPVGGRLSVFIHAWQEITNDEWILNAVRGYELPFVNTPTSNLNPAPHIVKPGEDTIIDAEVEKLLAANAVEEISEPFFLNQIFLVPKPHGGWRPVVNLKPLNSYLNIEHFKMENISMVADVIRKGWWMAKLDLKDAFLTVRIADFHKKYLQFEWNSKYFQFRSLPFGLATAPYAFTKITKPVVGFLRERGVFVIIYIDDLLVLAASKSLAEEHISLARNLFERLGFILNFERSILTPSQTIEFLGFEIDSIELTWSIPKAKKEKIKTFADSLTQESLTTPRKLAQLIGLVTSASLGFQTTNLYIRDMQVCLIQELRVSEKWDRPFEINHLVLQQIRWWSQNIEDLPGSPIFHAQQELIIESDASLSGWGARCGNTTTGGVWSSEDRVKHPHINSLELLAAFLALKSFCKDKENITVLLKMDNKSAVAYVNKLGGTRSRKLNNVALEIWQWSLDRKIWIKSEYLPGIQNLWADWESRHAHDPSDWMLRKDLVKLLFQHHPCNVDLFASRTNHQLPQYWSWKPDPHSQGTDAFLKNWKECQGYVFPPFCLVGRCVRQCIQQEAKILLIAPIWKSQFWYPLLLYSLFSLPVLLPSVQDLLSNPEGQNHPLCVQQLLVLVAWPISGNEKETQEFQKKQSMLWDMQSDPERSQYTSLHGQPTYAGVVNEVLIPFKNLFQFY